MHIEKINDNQIKCILSQHDLLARELDLSELAYGTEKARSLFREMIEQAHDDFGFEAENTPLMVEAIPVSRDSIILIITRMDNPDELDTRFSRFSSMAGDDIAEDEIDCSGGADEILDLFRSFAKKNTDEDMIEDVSDDTFFQNAADEFHQISSRLEDLAKSCSDEISETSDTKQLASSDPEETQTSPGTDKPINVMRIYAFEKLDDLLEISRVLHPIYNGVNSLYKDPADSVYYLVIYQSHHTPADFNRVCNLLSEYGQRVKGSGAREAYYTEHYNCIVSQTALQRLFLF